jgi:hypothetical protein
LELDHSHATHCRGQLFVDEYETINWNREDCQVALEEVLGNEETQVLIKPRLYLKPKSKFKISRC